MAIVINTLNQNDYTWIDWAIAAPSAIVLVYGGIYLIERIDKWLSH